MISKAIFATAAGAFALFSPANGQACSGPLTLDNFASYSSNTNSLNSYTSDDASMTSISAAGGTLSFTPNDASYFYETVPCQALATNGYTAITFGIKGPANSTFIFELQTQSSCTDVNATSEFIPVENINGESQTVSIPFGTFTGSNLDAISAIVWEDFSSTAGAWQLNQIQFECGASAPTPTDSTTASATPTATATETSTEIPTDTSTVVPTETSTSAPTETPTDTSTLITVATTCNDLLIDDFESQSRLTFLYYNAMFESSSDDATMKSVIVGTPAPHRMTLTPQDTDSYWYTEFNCMNAVDTYGGISTRIKAAAGTKLIIQLQSSTSCSDDDNLKTVKQTSSQLGWTFDGTEKLYSIPFSKFKNLGTGNLMTLIFTNLTKSVSFGPMEFYCGDTVAEYTVPATSQDPTPTSTVPITTETASAIVIDTFSNQDSNSLNFWHGGDDGLSLNWGNKKLTIQTNDTDYAFYTQVSDTCSDITPHDGGYLHIAYSGSNAFTVALQQHNLACNESAAPYPETWDSLEAERYATANDIYIPMNHFNINRTRAIGFAFKGFYTTNPTTFTKVEIVKTAPSSMTIPSKLPSGTMMFACTRPNSFAFAIDDGDPALAQAVLKVIRKEDIKVTFFTVGLPLKDHSTNLTNVYKEMQADGHQIALHSYTHPPMEGLPTDADVDWEFDNDFAAIKEELGVTNYRYFRPPFGTEGARMRQRLAAKVQDPLVIQWSVDVEDWLWAETDTPEKQLDAFRRDVAAGGNLVVMHYLYNSTVSYLSQFIQIARDTGKEMMRVDQCMEDPDAPPLPG